MLCAQGVLPEGSAAPCVVINGKALTFSFALDALEVIAQLSQDFIPALPNDKVCVVWGMHQAWWDASRCSSGLHCPLYPCPSHWQQAEATGLAGN